MAFKRPRTVGNSTPTGLVWLCPVSAVKHPTPLASPIMAGPKRFFLRCACGANMFFCPDWKADMGLTEREAVARGYLVLSSVIR